MTLWWEVFVATLGAIAAYVAVVIGFFVALAILYAAVLLWTAPRRKP